MIFNEAFIAPNGCIRTVNGQFGAYACRRLERDHAAYTYGCTGYLAPSDQLRTVRIRVNRAMRGAK